MEKYQGEIFLMYIVQNKPLTQVREHLLQKHGLEVPVKALKTKLMQWGYTKNIKRGEARQILREKGSRDAAGKSSSFTLRQRPVALEKITKHGHRAGLLPHGGPQQASSTVPSLPPNNDPASNSTRQIACRTPPPPTGLPPNLPNHRWVPSEKILFHLDTLIKGSFEAGKWRFNGNEFLILSSPMQETEKSSLHSFLSHLIDGSAAVKFKDFRLAGAHWRQAFLVAENLIATGEYHDILPNLVQQINDLESQGLSDVARMLKQHVTQCSVITLKSRGGGATSTSEVYQTLGNLDMIDMSDLEERIMQRFAELFTQYLGPECYNTFVMSMNRARRRLLRQPWTRLEDFLPSVEEELDGLFGSSNRRSLDVLGLRAEILSQRGLDHEVEIEAKAILERVAGIRDDAWQRLYHLVRASFWGGEAQFRQGKWDEARMSLESAMVFAEEFRGVEKADIFEPERLVMKRYLEELQAFESNSEDLGS
ncbi:hypothetical protein V8F06_009555 [Rhypophila decipiens]